MVDKHHIRDGMEIILSSSLTEYPLRSRLYLLVSVGRILLVSRQSVSNFVHYTSHYRESDLSLYDSLVLTTDHKRCVKYLFVFPLVSRSFWIWSYHLIDQIPHSHLILRTLQNLRIHQILQSPQIHQILQNPRILQIPLTCQIHGSPRM